jgi:hypothetical protein
MAGTARITVCEDICVPLSYTLEASFFGHEKSASHFTLRDFEHFGKLFCKGLAIQFSGIPGAKDKQGKDIEKIILDELEKKNLNMKARILEDLYGRDVLDYGDSESESAASDDELPDELKEKYIPGSPKKKSRKTHTRKSSLTESP